MTVSLNENDRLTPFMLEGGGVRGRMVQLADVARTVLARYDYLPHVARLLGELLTAAAMLSANLKQEGIFTMQVRGKGPVPLVVVDAAYGGALRGFAEVPPDADAALRAMARYSPQALLGEEAYLAITLDPGAGMQRYQGVVALEGDSIAQAFTAYFSNSEQLDVEVRLAVGDEANGWRTGGLMIERMPDADTAAATAAANANTDADAWNYARAIAATVRDEELLDPLLDAPGLLYRLFHEEGVWVYPSHMLSVGCRCSRRRIHDLLMSMPPTDRAEMVVDGQISVHCQFCNKAELFTPEQVGLSVN